MLRAQALDYEFTEQSLEAALCCLERALAIDSSYALALGLSAYCKAERHFLGWSNASEAQVADDLRVAARAIELGKDDPNVLWMAAYAFRVFEADLRRARELVNRSLQLNPNSAIALTMAGTFEVMLGKPAKAFELLRRAERLSPRDPKGWYREVAIALAHFAAAEFEQAVARATTAWAQNACYAPALRILAASLAKLGRVEEAAKVVRQLLKLEPQLTLSTFSSRVPYMDEGLLKQYLEALRTAGLPD